VAPSDDHALRLLRRYVRIDTHGDPERGLAFLEEELRRGGVPYHRFTPRGAGPVLIAGAWGRTPGPKVLLATHGDTVPPTRPGRSRAGTVVGDRLYGRGALDMKAGVILALLLMTECWRSPGRPLALAVTTDEERESAGAWWCASRLPPGIGLVLVPEPTQEVVNLSAWGRGVFWAGFQGTGGHGEGFGRPGEAPNPLRALARFLEGLPRGVQPLRAWTEGDGEVTLPRRALSRLDVLVPPGKTLLQREQDLARRLELLRKRFPPLTPVLTRAPRATPWLPPYRTPRGHGLVRAFLRTVQRSGGPLRVEEQRGVGDFNIFGSVLPTVVYGPKGEGAHGDPESLSLRSFRRCRRVYADFASGLTAPSANG
jgi:acetylornithine deacetylase/succinyl-diaminopimelate desuccinylase-like protein